MKQYNLSEIMKGAHNSFRTGKYATFADALRKSWKVAKFSKEVESRREANEAYFAAKKQEQADREKRRAELEATRQERMSERMKENARVEAECKAYGYGLGNHYSMFSGWGNYCGD